MADESGRILVVDDNRVNRLKLSLGLEQQGHTVSLAEGGREALELLEAEPYDVVLLDILMPEMDGYEVLERIKGDRRLRDIPVIVISALDEIESVVRCIEMGAEDYLPKSFNPTLLRARLNSSLQKKKLRDLEKKYLQQEVMLRQSEKLATLGKLSAGMAHELNNPAAAAQRAAAQLQATFTRLQETQLKLSELGLTGEQRAFLLELDRRAQERAKTPEYLGALDRSDREAELEAWLDENGIENGWEVSPTLVGAGYGLTDLAILLETLRAEQFLATIDWLSCSSTIYSLVEEINQGSSRVSEIVKALKAYSYLDQAPIQSVDLHEGLDNTLIILRAKLRPGVIVHREYDPDLPRIEAYGSELNQVWTNLLDNAIDAMNGVGDLTLRTRHDGESVFVEVEDSGPGILPAIQANIFDPFFTTKEPGKGTGLGLNISHNIVVQKHRGTITVDSHPGKTRFEVRLPTRPVETPTGP
jgi:signal transduction histidine kinase